MLNTADNTHHIISNVAHAILKYYSLNASISNLCLCLSPSNYSYLLRHIYIYVNNYISLTQGGLAKQQNIWHRLFSCIDHIFQPNDMDNTTRKDTK